jgi:hypothetical protein
LRPKVIGLVAGTRQTASLGRVAFWLVFGLAVYFWLWRPAAEFPQTLGDTLWVVLAYNLGGKAVNNFSRRGRRHREGGDEDDR